MDTLRAVVFTTLFFLALPGASNASEDSEEGQKMHLETNAIWGYSFLFNFLGCLPSAFCVIVCLWAKLTIAEKVITNFMAFASGVLIGGTLLHLLPDIAEGSSDQLNQGLTSTVLITISLMIMMDAIVELSHKKSNDSNNESPKKVNPNIEVSKASDINQVLPADFPIPFENALSSQSAIHATDSCPPQPQPLSYSALLLKPDVATNLMGEALHNFNDGIAIATAFSLSWQSGIAIFAAVIIHEIPQELSDVSIISKAGGTWVQCLVLNLLVACTSFFGVIVGASVSTLSETASKVLGAINAGCFIILGFRLAFNHVIPKVSSRIEIILHILVFNAGWISMFVLTYIEKAIGGEH